MNDDRPTGEARPLIARERLKSVQRQSASVGTRFYPAPGAGSAPRSLANRSGEADHPARKPVNGEYRLKSATAG
jgi:hypothetical protein